MRAAALLAALTLVGCRSDPPKRTAPTIARLAPDAAVAATVDAKSLELARAARDEAHKLARRCKLYRYYDDNALRYEDTCDWDATSIEPFRNAASALIAAAPDAGGAIVFIEHVRLFREWIELHGGSYAGALSHYQDLARAWNALQPQDPISTDPFDKATSPPLPPDAGSLVWQRCPNGPCVVFIERR